MDELTRFLQQGRRRLRWRDTWGNAQRTLWLPLAAGILLQGAGRVWPIPLLNSWLAFLFAMWFLGLSLAWLVQRPSLYQAAVRLDLELGLKERLSTAWELQHNPLPAAQAGLKLFIQPQRNDALQCIRSLDLKTALPFTWSPPQLRLAGLLLALLLGLVWLPNPMDQVLAERQAVRQAAAQQAEQLESLAEELEEQIARQDAPTPEQEALLRQLEDLIAALRGNPGDLDKALADLSRAQETLRQQLNPLAEVQSATLQALAARLQSLTGQPRSENQSAADFSAQALQALAEQMAELNDEQRQAAALALAQMAAQAAQSGEPALAQALQAMSQALQQGDPQAAAQAASQAAQALSQAQQSLSQQAQLQQALAQLSTSQQALAQAAQQARLQSQPGSTTGQPSSSSAPGSSSQPGQPGGSQGSGTSQQPGGGGTSASTLPPGTSSGVAGQPQGNRPGQTGADLSTQVYTPWLVNPTSGNPLFIPGQDSGSGSTQVLPGQSQLPGLANPSLVPYYQVFGTYLNAANQALQTSAIPASLQFYIQQYFLALNP